MTATTVLFIVLLLVIKHFIVDFPLQKPYHYLNKGTYGHMGGIQHALGHGIATGLVISLFFPGSLPFICFLVDAIIHYHIDWAKVNLNKKMGWGPTTHEQFWILLGVDQLLHMVTYLGIIYFLIN